MRQSHSWNILWEPYPLTDIRFTGCLTETTQKVLHIGCWTHCRRLWVDALPSDRTAMDIIDPIGEMFRNEDLFRMMKLSGEQIKERRLKLTGPILERIHHKDGHYDAGCEDYG